MYLILYATGVKFGIHKKWEQLTLSEVTVASLFADYRKVWLTLCLTSDPTPIYLDLDDARAAHALYPGPVQEWLDALGDTPLPTREQGPLFKRRVALYGDAFKSGYTVTPVNSANSAHASIPEDDKTDVRLSRTSPVTDYTHFFNHCLVSINGFYHLTDTDGVNGIVVSQAMASARYSRQNQIGLLSFSNVCTLQVRPLTAEMLSAANAGQVNVTLPYGLENKTVILVIGGYLHFVDGTGLKRISPDTYRVDFNNLPLLDRYYCSKRYLDLSALPLSLTNNNLDEVTQENLLSYPVLSAYLTLSQSFVVILDCPEIYTEKQYVKRTGLPDKYITFTEPKYPLVTDLGRHPEYWYTEEDGQYSLSVYDSVVANRLYYTALTQALVNVDGARVPLAPGYISSAHLLLIGRDV